MAVKDVADDDSQFAGALSDLVRWSIRVDWNGDGTEEPDRVEVDRELLTGRQNDRYPLSGYHAEGAKLARRSLSFEQKISVLEVVDGNSERLLCRRPREPSIYEHREKASLSNL
jgi:hypothetical protein